MRLRWTSAFAAALAVATSLVPPVSAQRTLTVKPTAADAPITDVLDRYGRAEAGVGDLTAVQAADHVQALRRVAPRWIGADAADAGRRRLAVATYVIDLIDQNFEAIWRQGIALDLIEWACRTLREVPPQPAERRWHVGVFALFERADGAPRLRGVVVGTTLADHIDDAEVRFPGEGEWALAKAIDRELRTWPLPADEPAERFSATIDGPVVELFRRATEFPIVRDEAHVRLGFFALRQGQYDAALAELGRAGKPADSILRYWQDLFRGRALMRMSRHAEAIEAFRRAFAEIPNAQSATFALGAALVADGRTPEAGDLVARAIAAEPPFDPWRYYGFPAYRHLPAIIAELRRVIRPGTPAPPGTTLPPAQGLPR